MKRVLVGTESAKASTTTKTNTKETNVDFSELTILSHLLTPLSIQMIRASLLIVSLIRTVIYKKI